MLLSQLEEAELISFRIICVYGAVFGVSDSTLRS
jgi:hypothetical protein